MTETISSKILSRIYGNGRGWAFSQADFADLGGRSAIDLTLHRLTRDGTIRRVIRGIYDYPRHSDLLDQPVSPDIHQAARALARKFNWRIQPSGPTALNLLGLSTQVPGRYIYNSDGPDRTYQIGKTTLSFKHQAPKHSGLKRDESGVIVQALKALGEDRITDKTIRTIRDWLPAEKRAAVLKDTRGVTGWVYAAIHRICREDSDG